MTNGSRIALLAAVVVVAVVGFIVLKPDDKNDKKSGTQASQPATAPAPTTGATAPEQAPEPEPVEVVVKGGKPVGGIKEIDANKGDRVRFVVSSDVADEIHVHGYDLMKDVEAGGSVSFSFPAKIDGEFEVELEDRGEQIAKLVVQP